MKTNKLLTASFFGTIATCLILSFASSEKANSQGAEPARIPIERPKIDTFKTPPVVDRIAEKTEELKAKTREIGKNSRSNERQASKLEDLVNRIPKNADCCPEADSASVLVEPAKEGNFFRRLGSRFGGIFRR